MDLIDSCPAQLAPNSIIVFDWCNRVLQTIPEGITCEEIVNCIDCDLLLSILTFGAWLLVDPVTCTISADPAFVNSSIITWFDCVTWVITIGYATYNLACIADFFSFTFTDWLNVDTVNNGDAILVQWLHGMHMIIGPSLIQVDLPGGATNGQVLTRSTINDVAYRANPLEICCDQIQECMAPIIAGLQAQINILAQLLCPCWGLDGQYPIAVYEDGLLVMPHITILDFVGCFHITDLGMNHAQIELDLWLNFGWCVVQEDWTVEAILTICWETVDLGCLASYPPSRSLAVSQEWFLVDAHVTLLNFVGCMSATPGGLDTIDISYMPTFTRWGCTGPNAYELEMCGQTVDLSCLAPLTPPTIVVKNTAFVMKNWSDITGTVERFDLPFLTIQAAYDAMVTAGIIWLVIVYAWTYTETIALNSNEIDIEFKKNTEINGVKTVSTFVNCKITWHVNVNPVWDSFVGMWNVMNISHDDCNIEFDIDRIWISNQMANTQLFYIRWARSKSRVVCGSIKTTALLTNIITLANVSSTWASLDLVSWVWHDPGDNVRFYTVNSESELYRHHSYVTQTIINGVTPPTNAITNIVDSGGRVYMDNIFIQLNKVAPADWYIRFESGALGLLNINDVMIDTFPNGVVTLKGDIYCTTRTGILNFYGLSMVRWNGTWSNAINGVFQSVNVYWRFTADKGIVWAAMLYGIFNGNPTWEHDTTWVPIIPRAPFQTPFNYS